MSVIQGTNISRLTKELELLCMVTYRLESMNIKESSKDSVEEFKRRIISLEQEIEKEQIK